MAVATTNELYEWVITRKIEEKAQELGIEFKVQHSIKEGMDDIVFHIKRDLPIPNEYSSEEVVNHYIESNQKLNFFTDYVTDIVVGKYAERVRFKYPSTL